MNFVSIRIITDDIRRLVGFYEAITGFAPIWYTEDFAELATPACTLAIASSRTMSLFGTGAACAADNHSAIIEFRVGDVDEEYRKLAGIMATSSKSRRPCPGATARSCSAIQTATWSTFSRRSAWGQSGSSTSDRSTVGVVGACG